MKKSRSVSFSIFSMRWPVWWTRMPFNSARILRISFAWMSISVACPWTPPNGSWIMIRAWGSAKRLPLAPAASSSAPIDAACPMQIVEIAGLPPPSGRNSPSNGIRAGHAHPRGRPRSTPLRCSCAEGRAASEDQGDLLAVERFALEQRARQRMELFEVLFEDHPRAMRAVADDALDLHVDLERGLLAVVLVPRDFPPEENVLLVLAERDGPEFLRHAPLADHLARHRRGLREIIPGPGRELVQHDLLR